MKDKAEEKTQRVLSLNSSIWVIDRRGPIPHVAMMSVNRVIRYIGGGVKFMLDGFGDRTFEAHELYDYNNFQEALDNLNKMIDDEVAGQKFDEPNRVQVGFDLKDIQQIRRLCRSIMIPKVSLAKDHVRMLYEAVEQMRENATEILRIVGTDGESN